MVIGEFIAWGSKYEVHKTSQFLFHVLEFMWIRSCDSQPTTLNLQFSDVWGSSTTDWSWCTQSIHKEPLRDRVEPLRADWPHLWACCLNQREINVLDALASQSVRFVHLVWGLPRRVLTSGLTCGLTVTHSQMSLTEHNRTQQSTQQSTTKLNRTQQNSTESNRTQLRVPDRSG